MKRLFTPLFLLAALVAALLAGCSSASRIIGQGLDIRLQSVSPQADGTVKVAWQVANSNIAPYLLSRINLKISLNGTSLGAIEDNEPLAVPASTTSGRTSVITPSKDAAKWLQARDGSSASYQVDTKLTILIYGDTTENTKLRNSGSVPITSAAAGN